MGPKTGGVSAARAVHQAMRSGYPMSAVRGPGRGVLDVAAVSGGDDDAGCGGAEVLGQGGQQQVVALLDGAERARVVAARLSRRGSAGSGSSRVPPSKPQRSAITRLPRKTPPGRTRHVEVSARQTVAVTLPRGSRLGHAKPAPRASSLGHRRNGPAFAIEPRDGRPPATLRRSFVPMLTSSHLPPSPRISPLGLPRPALTYLVLDDSISGR